MKFLIEALERTGEFRQLEKAVADRALPAAVTGTAAIHKAGVISALCEQQKKTALILAADEPEAQRLKDDLTAMGLSSLVYPARDFNFRDTAGASHEYERERLQVLSLAMEKQIDCVIACADAAVQFTLPPQSLRERTLTLRQGQVIELEEIARTLSACGYERAEQTEGTGQFSLRGGIIDFYSPSAPAPVRIEFWGDEIDTISYYDIETQRRTDPAESVTITPSVEVFAENKPKLAKQLLAHAATLRGKNAAKARAVMEAEAEKLQNGLHIGSFDKYIGFIYDELATLFDYFDPAETLLFVSEPAKAQERIRSVSWQWGEDIGDLLEEGILCRGCDTFSEDWISVTGRMEAFSTVFLDAFVHGSYPVAIKTLVNMDVRQLSSWGGSTQLLTEDLQAVLERRYACVVLAGADRAARTVADELKAAGLPAAFLEKVTTVPFGTVAVTTGTLSAGLELPGAKFCLISHGHSATGATLRKKKKSNRNSQEIYSLAELTPGDYVVHVTHGIGIFDGIRKIEMQGIIKDYIKVRYAKNDVLYVPVTQLDLVSKYIGPKEDSAVKVTRLGGTEWTKAKTRVRAAVKDIARELIRLYAQRMQQKGYAFSEDTEWQHDFEARFEFDETEDQLRCISEIKSDMEREVPMDRLLCGDVGFGKTEVALRAAFKCVMDSKQCAVLVPTTILAWQHYQTFCRRMEGFPINIELLSRFRTPRQQEEIIRKLKQGNVDIIVGTHRVVSNDIRFKDLGLVIIDEEQRFGVAQKEKLKELKKNVDVLTLSATPIPRTLNMALSGIRDMSVIEEAPHDRRPVQTYVLEYDDALIMDALRRELRRGGQAYYLHNDVASIERVAAHIQAKIPEARVGFGHGKMSEQELSDIWRKLLEHEIDILVCTTIIETGVDVPNANTLIIDNADRMGLSQLHQLRGRVGRSTRRAYAYFTFVPGKVLSEVAQKRLSAIRDFTEFGSGFKIAMRDLEIRGAGNVLGGEQHGHMEVVGYDMYLKLLNEAVQLEKGEQPTPVDMECSVDMQVQAHIPESYIDSTQLRLEVYRMIASIKSYDDASDVTDELIDRFGEPPAAVQGLIDIALMRNLAASLGIDEVKQQGNTLLLYQQQMDMKIISKLVSAMKGRVMLSAGSRPYISVALSGKEPLDVLEDTLKIMDEARQNG